jgi:fatty acid desaturase
VDVLAPARASPSSCGGLPWLLAATRLNALVMFSTHDISHASRQDLGDTEQAVGCALSWPIAWPDLPYRNLHMLHHRMNGMDLRDPERRESTAKEAAKAGPLRRFHVQDPFWVSAVVMGGIQLIGSMVWFAWKLRDDHSKLIGGLRTDPIGSCWCRP